MSVPQIRNRQRKGAEKRNECGPFRKEHMVQYTVNISLLLLPLSVVGCHLFFFYTFRQLTVIIRTF